MPCANSMRFIGAVAVIFLVVVLSAGRAGAQETTSGFLNLARGEAPGTLLSGPMDNDSAAIGRTTTINYVNGWLIVGGEAPGSMPGSDLSVRVYDISDPANPIRRHPSDFLLTYPNDRWYVGNSGWNAHGSAQSGPYLLPAPVLRVDGFGAPVELGGTNGIPDLSQFPIGYNRSSQAGPWVATMLWYGTSDQTMEIQRVTTEPWGYANFQVLAQFDHVGAFGGGDWHPQFFGDLLIYARSGGAAQDGVVVYRLEYVNFDDPDDATHSIIPHYVGSLQGGFEGYWPTLFSDGSGLFVIGSATDLLIAADITDASEPGGDDAITVAASLTIPGFTNASYPVFQDNFGFIHNRKINMTSFLAGDPSPIELTLDQAGTGIDTSQMSLPLGNLWITGGYDFSGGVPPQSQGMAVWVHQQAPDTTAPQVSYHIPQANRTNYPRFAPLSFLLHEHPRHGGLRNEIDFAVRPVLPDDALGAAVDGILIHDFSGVLTFTPSDGLAADTTYQVDFFSDDSNLANPIGFFDAAGNVIEPYTFRFATGGGINADPLPEIQSLVADIYHLEPEGEVTVTALATGVGMLDYRFNFDGTWSEWSAVPSDSHIYDAAGRPRVLVQVRDGNGVISTGSLNLLVMVAPTGPLPTQSSTLAVGDDGVFGRRIWVVNPDANSVSVLDSVTGAMIEETAVGDDPRGIARDGAGRYWVTCQGSDEIRVLAADGSTHATLPLPYGSAPFGIVASPDGQSMFVSLYGSGRLLRYAVGNLAAEPDGVDTFPTPRAIAVSGDGQRVLVTRFISPDLQGEVAEYEGATLNFVRTITLTLANPTDSGDRASGTPNYLAGIAISPDGTRALVASKQDNVLRGLQFGVGDLTHETTVRAVLSVIDLEANSEIHHARRDFDNSDSPSAVVYSPLGDTVFVTLQGTNRLVGLDALSGLQPLNMILVNGSTETSPALPIFELSTGLAPQGVLIDPVSAKLLTQDFMGRSVTVREAAAFLNENRTTFPLVVTTETVGTEPLGASILLGKQIFYNAEDPRMSGDSYISCASCHIDGGHDGQTWDFTGRGEGFRRTTDLRGRGGVVQGNVHWTGNFDEIQDFEHDIRGPFGGTGFIDMTDEAFDAAHPNPSTVKAGLSPDLDALAAYVASLGDESIPRSPEREVDGSLSVAAARGRDVFLTQSCMDCHSGGGLTDSVVFPVMATTGLHNVGTGSALSGGRLAGAFAGIDTPTLRGLHATRTYLHRGQASTLGAVFDAVGGQLLMATAAEVIAGSSVSYPASDPARGGGGFDRGLLSGAAVGLAGSPVSGIRFSAVDGGIGGVGRIAIRYLRQYSNANGILRVNGAEYPLALLRQQPDNGWQSSGWRWVETEVVLDAGQNNIIEISSDGGIYSGFQVNAILVSTANDFQLAAPHRVVGDLAPGDRSDLFAYLRSLDGSSDGSLATGPAYQQWLADHLTPEQLLDSANTDPSAMVSSSGISRIWAFLLGGVPTNDSSSVLPELDLVEDVGGGEPVLRYLIARNPSAVGWRVVVETSIDMIDWTVVATSDHGAAATGIGIEGEIDGEFPLMVVGPGEAVLEAGEKRFYRARAIPLP